MVLVNDRLSAHREASSITTLQVDIATDVTSRQPVTEELTVGELSSIQAAD